MGTALPRRHAEDERTFFGHPAGLYVLFFTEMWERFCYYGMRAILRYYLLTAAFTDRAAGRVWGHTGMISFFEWMHGPLDDKGIAAEVQGLSVALTYFTPVIGGWLADRYLGQRRSVVVGAIIMAAGEFLLMKAAWFYPGMMILIIGNGFFKPNISTQVGVLYKDGDERRDRAFSIFYVGINIGALMAPFICGYLGEKVGWGFGSAGVGLLLGLCIYLYGSKYLAPDQIMGKAQLKKDASDFKAPVHEPYRKAAEKAPEPTTDAPLSRDDWMKVGALCVLNVLNIVFWGVYEQQGGTIADWALESTERHILGWEMPASWFQSVNPIMILAFTPVLNMFWETQARKKKEPTSVGKMAIGCFLLAASFLFMVGAAKFGGERVSMLWLFGMFALLTLGELYLSPIGLSLVTKVSPPKLLSLMMGTWFLSGCFGGYLSGYLGIYWTRMSKMGFFSMLTILSLVSGLLIWALSKPLKRALGNA